MSQQSCQVLLIEDEPAVAERIQALLQAEDVLKTAQALDFQVTQLSAPPESAETAPAFPADVVLLDLQLAGGQAPDILADLRNRWENTAIIAFTEEEDETLVIQAFQHGADGYLRLKHLDSSLLIYEVLAARERQQYRNDLAQRQRLAQQRQEFAQLESLAQSSAPITARMFGVETIRESLPELFQELSQSYGQLLDLALEQRMFRVEHQLSDRLRALADKMGFLKASPRDVIELHTQTLKQKSRDVPLAKAQGYVNEGRLLVLELMGYLTSFYRKYYIGLSTLNLSAPNPPGNLP
ncbi:MAG: response regulator [Cyanobacteria bacterium RI_101]|jgi:DNA-binding NarL/FixJ family response regulator|nr:response regulator [Cyanobacteria bacterium RI_101]